MIPCSNLSEDATISSRPVEVSQDPRPRRPPTIPSAPPELPKQQLERPSSLSSDNPTTASSSDYVVIGQGTSRYLVARASSRSTTAHPPPPSLSHRSNRPAHYQGRGPPSAGVAPWQTPTPNSSKPYPSSSTSGPRLPQGGGPSRPVRDSKRQEPYQISVGRNSHDVAAGVRARIAEAKNFDCGLCMKTLPRSEFSRYQLDKLKENNNKMVTCVSCTPKQQLHLTCQNCDLELPRSKFARNQRNRAEGAVCIACQKKSTGRTRKRDKDNPYDSADDDNEMEADEDD